MHLILTILLLATLLLPNSANAATLIGVVVGVSDGDTIKVVDASNTQHKIRLLGIDAPEFNIVNECAKQRAGLAP
jgi:endonuclease YncB( thermonuclease family)